MKTKEAQEIRHGMVLGDGFLVDSVYMAIGSAPRCHFALGYPYGIKTMKLSIRYLGPFGHKLSVKG